MSNFTPEQITNFRQAADRRRIHEADAEVQRRDAAWAIARQVADMLRRKFGVSKVVVFGSLARETGFTKWSDIDIAVWGLDFEDTFKAMGAASDLGQSFAVNLVDVNCCKKGVLAEIEKYGINL